MSADNTILILHTIDGYRVSHLQGVESMYYWPTGKVHPTCKELRYNPDTNEETEHNVEDYEERNEINPQYLKECFSNCDVFPTALDAEIYAINLLDEIGYVEYGIRDIYYPKEFPK